MQPSAPVHILAVEDSRSVVAAVLTMLRKQTAMMPVAEGRLLSEAMTIAGNKPESFTYAAIRFASSVMLPD